MKKHENCHNLLDSLSDYVDGSISDTLCSEIEKHIASCEDCRIVVDTLKKTVYLYHATAEEDTPEVPEDVRERLYHRLDLDEFMTS
jgi:anti-sigma factor RsiW